MSLNATVTRVAPKRMSTLDKWLAVWIGLAMIAGLLLGRFIPGLSEIPPILRSVGSRCRSLWDSL